MSDVIREVVVSLHNLADDLRGIGWHRRADYLDDAADLLARLNAAEERQRALEEALRHHGHGGPGHLEECIGCAALARLPAAEEGT